MLMLAEQTGIGCVAKRSSAPRKGESVFMPSHYQLLQVSQSFPSVTLKAFSKGIGITATMDGKAFITKTTLQMENCPIVPSLGWLNSNEKSQCGTLMLLSLSQWKK